MVTVINADNMPAVLAQIAERQDELAAQIEALTALQADHAICDEERERQDHVQAAALRASIAQLSRNIADVSKAANGNGTGNRGNSNTGRNGNSNGNSNGHSNVRAMPNGRNVGMAGAAVGGTANVGPLEARADVGGGIGTRQNRSQPIKHKQQSHHGNPKRRKSGVRIGGCDNA